MSRRSTQLQQPLGMHPSVREEEGTWVGTSVTRTRSLSFSPSSFCILVPCPFSFHPREEEKTLLPPPRSRVPLFRLHRSRRHRQTGGQALWSLLRPRPPPPHSKRRGRGKKGTTVVSHVWWRNRSRIAQEISCGEEKEKQEQTKFNDLRRGFPKD